MERELQPSTQQSISKVKFHPKDEWTVKVDKTEFALKGKEAQLLKEATERNVRGIIWFEKFAISIPHICSISRTKSGKQEENYNKKYNIRK